MVSEPRIIERGRIPESNDRIRKIDPNERHPINGLFNRVRGGRYRISFELSRVV